jgi:hypothetical protein
MSVTSSVLFAIAAVLAVLYVMRRKARLDKIR